MRILLVLLMILLAGCPKEAKSVRPITVPVPSVPRQAVQVTQEEPEPEGVPYPDAVAPDPMPAVATEEDQDCFGLISLPPGRPRIGTWAIGEYVGRAFTPILFFNTKRDALDCLGSEDGMQAMHLTRSGWSR